MEKYCDNKSVGVVLTNRIGKVALLERGRFPIGMAPPAGHIDSHGAPERAAVEEVVEELGVVLAVESLARTAINGRRVDNVCRRAGGNHHVWTVYEARVEAASLHPDKDETKGAAWIDPAGVQSLADRTRNFRSGKISAAEWFARPGLEETWLDFLLELGYVK